MEKKWQILKADEETVSDLQTSLSVSKTIAKLLVLRGIKTYSDAKVFFRPELTDLYDPFLMKGMSISIERIETAISNQEKVLIYGDYDVDGITSVSMMYDFLRNYIHEIEFYIPCRYKEGYGISSKSVEYAIQNNFSLIITLDCGIKAINQVDLLAKKKIDVIICDHHQPSNILPEAYSILNPKQTDCKYPYKELSGCGVGFKLITAYCIKNTIPFSKISEYLDLLLLSISADLVHMTGENRILAFFGLKRINTKPREGIRALLKYLNLQGKIQTSDISFGLAPRINASGRVSHAKNAVKLLITKDSKTANNLAHIIEENNNERRSIDKEITHEAINKIDHNKASIIVYNSNWSKGVIGIVASRILEKYYKPTIVFSEKNNILTGSARSVSGFNIYEAISICAELCETFGGHKYAAGLTIKQENFNNFKENFEKQVQQRFKNEQQTPTINIDAEIELKNINSKLIRIITQFAPFGPKNYPPIFLTKNIKTGIDMKKIGIEKNHLKCSIIKNENQLSAIGFGLSHYYESLENGNYAHICYSISENKWKGILKTQLILKDIKKSSAL